MSDESKVLDLHATIDADAVIAIRISEIETELTDRSEELKDEVEKLQKAISKGEAKIKKLLKQFGEDMYKEEFRPVLDALNALENEKWEIKISAGRIQTRSEEEPTTGIHTHITICEKSSKSDDDYYVRTQGLGWEKTWKYAENENIMPDGPASSAIKIQEVEANIEETKEDLKKTQISALEVRKALQDINKYERQIKAQLATHKLSQTDDGKKLLETIKSFKLKNFPQLPNLDKAE